MQEEFLHPYASTYVALLKGCASLKDTEKTCELHVEIDKHGLVERDTYIGSTLDDARMQSVVCLTNAHLGMWSCGMH